MSDRQVALVVGGTKGIGAETSRRLANTTQVYANFAHDAAAAAQFEDDARRQGLAIQTVQADVSSKKGVDDLVAEILDKAERLDIAVFCAVHAHLASALEVDEDAWWQVQRTNAAPFLWLGQQMATSALTGGRLIAVTSPFSHRFVPGYSAIGPSKAALESLVVYLAVELADRQITVNAVSGGLIDTPLLRSRVPERELNAVARRTPLGRIGQPADMAGLIVWLASPEASWMTGQVLTLDGGYFLR
jgi:NAD(P)-dependent dehydrogenase (short-subunit alcohol dehydrogenase family)